MAKIVFREDLCKGCELCRNACPQRIIEMKEEINAMGYHPAHIVEKEKCTGCAFCAMMCPDLVITVER